MLNDLNRRMIPRTTERHGNKIVNSLNEGARNMQRETLYVWGPDDKASTIISYNPQHRCEPQTHTSTCKLEDGVISNSVDDFDFRDGSVLSGYEICRYLLSRFLSHHASNKVIRIYTNTDESVQSVVHGIVMASNILSSLSVYVFSSLSFEEKRRLSFGNNKECLIFILLESAISAPPTTSSPPHGILTNNNSNTKDHSNYYTYIKLNQELATISIADSNQVRATKILRFQKCVIDDIIEKVLIPSCVEDHQQRTGGVIEILYEEMLCPVLWALGYISKELLKTDSSIIQLFLHSSCVGGISLPTPNSSIPSCFRVSITTNQHIPVLPSDPPNFDRMKTYMNLMERPIYSGSSIVLDYRRVAGLNLKYRIWQLFTAGYCDVHVLMAGLSSLGDTATLTLVKDILMYVSEHLDIVMVFVNDHVVFKRRSVTVDKTSSVAVNEAEPSAQESLLDQLILSPQAVPNCAFNVSRDWLSVNLSSFLARLVLTTQSSSLGISRVPNNSGRCVLKLGSSHAGSFVKHEEMTVVGFENKPSNVVIQPQLDKLNSDNINHVTVRFGYSQELNELKLLVQRLIATSNNSVSKFAPAASVLLVGQRNIGLGVRDIAEVGGLQIEFYAERVVRDNSGDELTKCAVKLHLSFGGWMDNPGLKMLESIFIRNDQNSLIGLTNHASCTIDILETDSRVTIANKLFDALQIGARNSNPYVLLRAEKDHCTFIGAVAIVVVNGWTRPAQQRVETRVAKIDAIYYVTRLIVSP